MEHIGLGKWTDFREDSSSVRAYTLRPPRPPVSLGGDMRIPSALLLLFFLFFYVVCTKTSLLLLYTL